MIFRCYWFTWVDKYNMFHVEQKDSFPIKEANHYLQTKDFLVTGEVFSLLYNAETEMLITQPQPKISELPKYYESNQYISHTDSNKGLFNFLYQTVKGYSLRKKTRLVNSLNKGPGSLLDIGAGTGDFLTATKKKGWITEGVEINPKARSLAEKKGIGLKASLEDFTGKEYDVITLWHVLEHLPDLEKTISEITDILKNGGHLVIAVPNFKSFDATYYKEFWAAYDVPRHLWHFSWESIPKLFRNKAELVKTHPMLFDAYYVCLLSEKYKSGKKLSLTALWTAWRSNFKAKRTKEHSSVIYVLRKA